MRNTKPVSQIDSRQLVPGHGSRRLYDEAEAAMSSSWILEDKDAIEWKDEYEIPGWGPRLDNKVKNVGGVKQPTPGSGNLPHHACGTGQLAFTLLGDKTPLSGPRRSIWVRYRPFRAKNARKYDALIHVLGSTLPPGSGANCAGLGDGSGCERRAPPALARSSSALPRNQ